MTLAITCTDMFCGAGGSTTGATLAGATVTLAINHWQRAIETHNTNYPDTTHVLTDLHKANPRQFKRTTLLIASPECTSHSLAKGRKRKEQGQLKGSWSDDAPLPDEAEERSRCTMWTPLEWAEYHDYQAVILENVVDVHLWRPFQAWLQAWKSLDYEYELIYLNSMHVHPTPQSRDRLYFVAWKRENRKPELAITPRAYCQRCDKEVDAHQVWKHPTRRAGKYKRQYIYGCPSCDKEVTPYYYAAANVIDWSLPVQRIGERHKPLAAKTLQRIAHGLEKMVCEQQRSPQQPYLNSVIIPPNSSLLTYYGNGQLVPLASAMPTVATVEHHALITTPTPLPAVEACGFRMLGTHEIQAAMAFPSDYVVTGTRREQVKQLGNAVTPPVMKLLVERVMASFQ